MFGPFSRSLLLYIGPQSEKCVIFDVFKTSHIEKYFTDLKLFSHFNVISMSFQCRVFICNLTFHFVLSSDRANAYCEVSDRFVFICNLMVMEVMEPRETRQAAEKLVKLHSSDLDDSLWNDPVWWISYRKFHM